MKKLILVALTVIALTGCQTYNAQMYGVSPDTNYAIKSLEVNEAISVGEFSLSRPLDTNCRAVGPITLPNNLTFQSYIKKALEDELKVGGAYAYQSPKVTLSGRINRLDMSSSKGLLRGYWDIDITLESSNGQSLTASEYYEFDSGFDGFSACKNTADGFMPTVQNLIGKIVKSPKFKDLIATKK
jgi:predicted small secreted protein